MTEADLLYKILIIGDSAVGKSSLLIQFSDQTFSDNYVSTIGVDFKIRSVTVENELIKLQIWDTAGQERFQSITANYYHGSQAIALVYDVTDRNSFDHLRKWISDVDRLAQKGVCKLIIGNKVDLADKRAVSREEGQAFADSIGAPFLETSAKTAQNVQEMFISMAKAIYIKQGRPKKAEHGGIDPWSLKPGQNIQGNQACNC